MQRVCAQARAVPPNPRIISLGSLLKAEQCSGLAASSVCFVDLGIFFFPPADCQQSVHPGMLWHFKASSRELICQHQLLPSLFLGGKQQAALLPFSAASPAADAAQLAVGAQGGMLTQAGQRQCVWGRGSGVFLVP